MDIVLLSRNPELLNECADLLNSQWKRSTSARVQSLEKCYTELPDSLLLVEKSPNGNQVIGHSRLTRVLEDPCGCWIGSVVIREDKRKKGYGKYIMQKTEDYVKALQFSTAYLNTHDQQGFYEHLGYTNCDPVSSISFAWSGVFPKSVLNSSYIDNQTKTNLSGSEVIECGNNIINCNFNKFENMPVPPPPPPPPLPKQSNKTLSDSQLKSNLGQYWMKKKL